MARFEGTIKEFHDYIGPKIRNKIQTITKKIKNLRNNVCEECTLESELQSAHRREKSRRHIIENILQAHMKDGIVICNLQTIEKEIIEAHYPLEENFLFLCEPFHKNYDSQHKKKSSSS